MTLRDFLITYPLAFLAGLGAGMALSSKWIIVRRRRCDENGD